MRIQLVLTWPAPQHIGCFIGSSPVASVARSFTPQQELRRFIIRTDVHYDAETKLLTAHLELPGLKQRDLSITLSTCVYNRVRQVVVAGRSKPTLSEAGYAIRERKFGEFSRTFAVPIETRVRLSIRCIVIKLTESSSLQSQDVSAEMQDGLLILKISMGPPATSEDSHEIPIQ